ncbi:MAG: hypothetical protein NTW01_13925 [Gammaproteobacteria bacterium]|nr:hypothetical protein [Gammaproteobacteria bacterium]
MSTRPRRRVGARLKSALESVIFAHRRLLLAVLLAITLLLAEQASRLTLEAGFDRAQPVRHPYSQVDLRHRDVFDGANPVRIAVLRSDGDLYDPVFLMRVKALTDGLAALPGIDRRHLRSLFTPEVRYVEVVEGRYFGGSVVPAEFDPEHATPAELARLRRNVAKAGITGRYVSADRRGVLIEAAWLARDPDTGQPFDQHQIMQGIDDVLRAARATSGGDFSVHVSGAPALARALAEEVPQALLVAAGGLLLSAVLLVFMIGAARVATISLSCMVIQMIWQLGLIQLAGLRLDPDAAWALAVTATAGLLSMAQFGLRWLDNSADGGHAGFSASLRSWHQLAWPLTVVLLTATAAAAALALISDVPLIRQIAVVTALGLLAALPITLLALPILLSWTGTARIGWRLADWFDARLASLGQLARPWLGLFVMVAVGALAGVSGWLQRDQPVEPAATDLARLSPANPAKADGAKLAAAFPRNVREFRVIVEADPDACTDPEVMEQVDRLVWQLENLPMVTGSTALPQAQRRVLTAFADGSPKFRVLPRNRETLRQAMAPISADTGLHADGCATLPISLYLSRRDAESLLAVANEVERFNTANAAEFFDSHRDVDAAYCAEQRRLRPLGPLPEPMRRSCPVEGQLAAGPLGASLARQQALLAFRGPAALVLAAALAAGCWLLLGDALATVAVLLPLALAGWIGLGLMAISGLALTQLTLTLWLMCLAAGLVGHLLIVRHLHDRLKAGHPLMAALRAALVAHGRILLVALAMAAGFALWILADYPAQRGAGKLLAIGWSVIAVSGLLVLPAFASLLLAGAPARAGRD